LNSLRWLGLSYNRLTASGFSAIAGSRRLAELKYLDLSSNAPGVRGLRTLASNPALRGLTTLLLGGSTDRAAGLTPALTYEFLSTLNLPYLRRLGLPRLPLDAMGAKALTAAKFGNLRRLHVTRCKLTDTAMARLLAAPTLQNLVELDAQENELRSGVTPLTDRRVMPNLSAANFSYNRIAADLIRKLKRRPGFVA
jgi:hypothetical protein